MKKLMGMCAIAGLCLGLGACGSSAEVGEACGGSGDCAVGLDCFNRDMGDAVCMSLCAAGDRLCAGGEVCLERSGGGTPVCYLGGSTALGGACTGGTACALGGVCIDTGTETACFQACTVGDDSPCASGETCMASSTTTDEGFCSM